MQLARLFALVAFLLAGFAPAPEPKSKKNPGDVAKQLEGTWSVERYEVGGRQQGGPGPTWEKVLIKGGAWSQTTTIDGRQLTTTPYLLALDPKNASRIDMAYAGMQQPLLYGVFRLSGDRLVVLHATSGPRPTDVSDKLKNSWVRWELRRTK